MPTSLEKVNLLNYNLTKQQNSLTRLSFLRPVDGMLGISSLVVGQL